MTDDIGITLNRLAREQMKLKLVADIAVDLTVCELEGIDRSEYVRELQALVSGIAAQIQAGDEVTA